MPSGRDTDSGLPVMTSVLTVCHFPSLAGSDSPASPASRMTDLDSGEKLCRGGCHSNSSFLVCLCNLILFIEFFSCQSSCMETTPDASGPKEQRQT